MSADVEVLHERLRQAVFERIAGALRGLSVRVGEAGQRDVRDAVIAEMQAMNLPLRPWEMPTVEAHVVGTRAFVKLKPRRADFESEDERREWLVAALGALFEGT
jgi:hypothetical protein